MGRGRMDSRGWTLCILFEVIDNWGIKCAGQSARLMHKHVSQAIIAQTYARCRFVSSDETTASGLSTCHRAFYLCEPFALPRQSKRRPPGF
ncbi:hypothetical protein Pyn_18496 [Prunus yedoensis var. nudiflora]|uniref:Uncharacterized protein n=1 Tax=Prunus yedoensis var. nudiflora TaxID=2094558 RepID=A0A314XXR1_PRUYE|nr:hypothetical protein Pyn_18496 [Prunus yedoensis var. nudiflora]